jgi:LL-diaminopimelate aminotransferase
VYTELGQREVHANASYYLRNAAQIREGLSNLGFTTFGGVNAPYVWVKTPPGVGSWEFFDQLIERAHVVSTPGAGFGACGEGYVRLSAFGKEEQIQTAVERIRKTFG